MNEEELTTELNKIIRDLADLKVQFRKSRTIVNNCILLLRSVTDSLIEYVEEFN